MNEKFMKAAENTLNSSFLERDRKFQVNMLTELFRNLYWEGIEVAAEKVDKYAIKASIDQDFEKRSFFVRIAMEIRALKRGNL